MSLLPRLHSLPPLFSLNASLLPRGRAPVRLIPETGLSGSVSVSSDFSISFNSHNSAFASFLAPSAARLQDEQTRKAFLSPRLVICPESPRADPSLHPGTFELHDTLPYLTAGMRAVVQDCVSKSFTSAELRTWNMLSRWVPAQGGFPCEEGAERGPPVRSDRPLLGSSSNLPSSSCPTVPLAPPPSSSRPTAPPSPAGRSSDGTCA